MNHLAHLMSVLVVLGAASPALFAQSKPRVVAPSNLVVPMAGTTLTAISASPTTISFTATDPDLGSVSGSSAAAVSWMTSGGSTTNTWTLKVQASTASFTNCPTVPTSAVTATCSSGGCGGAILLSTIPQSIATGKEVNGPNKAYSVTINFTLADSWTYVAKQAPACSLSLTYTVTAP